MKRIPLPSILVLCCTLSINAQTLTESAVSNDYASVAINPPDMYAANITQVSFLNVPGNNHYGTRYHDGRNVPMPVFMGIFVTFCGGMFMGASALMKSNDHNTLFVDKTYRIELNKKETMNLGIGVALLGGVIALTGLIPNKNHPRYGLVPAEGKDQVGIAYNF